MNSYVIFWWAACFSLILSSVNCKLNNEAIIQIDNAVFALPKGWSYKQPSSNNFVIFNDTNRIIVNITNDTSFTDTHLKSPLEYIETEDPNLLTRFAFNEPGVIYTSKENVEKIKRSNGLESKVRENPKPVLERVVKINDSSLRKEGVDYLCRFRVNGGEKWLPVSLPKYLNNFLFEVSKNENTYKKLYYPINKNRGKIGFLIKDFNHHIVLSARSNLINSDTQYFVDMLTIFNSMRIK